MVCLGEEVLRLAVVEFRLEPANAAVEAPQDIRWADHVLGICLTDKRDTMIDPGVQLVREWLQRQPFSLRILTLILFMDEAIKDEFGEESMKSFDRDLKEAYRKLPSPEGEAN
jgi:hypothetical protein